MVGFIYLLGLIALAIYMYYDDKTLFKHKVNWIFLVMYPIIFVYILMISILFAFEGFIVRKPPE